MKNQNKKILKTQTFIILLALGLVIFLSLLAYNFFYGSQEDTSPENSLNFSEDTLSKILPNSNPSLVNIKGFERELPERYNIVSIFQGREFISEQYYCDTTCIAIEIYDSELNESIAFVSDYFVKPKFMGGQEVSEGTIELFGEEAELIARKSIVEEPTNDIDRELINEEAFVFSAYACTSKVCVSSFNFPFNENSKAYYDSFKLLLEILK
ncbi:MAG: hypothetical protein KatS3mg085_657 [Candidatus Dojkabacteria bacterium]|nr:MAG: hypothetical protein KatS3mg085_657 [Candidatus Dojkabacteria bacterium]